MYAPGDPTAADIEDELSDPFRALRLLGPEPIELREATAAGSDAEDREEDFR